MTLTPQDADEIARQCPAVSYVSPMVRARAQIVYGSRNWVPTFINGVSPSFLKVQEWEDFDEGEMFTDADVRNANKVCVVGTTIKRELFQGRVAHRQGYPHQERLLPRRRRVEQEGGEHDGHGPGRRRAGPLDHHQVPRQRQCPDQHEPKRGRRRQRHHRQHAEQPLPGRP